jgi:hypothetical protein
VSRAAVIRRAFLEYHAGRITLAQLMAVLRDWRPKR